MIRDTAERTLTGLRHSRGLRLLLIAFLALVLQVPIGRVADLVSDREQRRDAAIAEVASHWGYAQSITGPVLVLPYTHRWSETAAGGQVVTRSEVRNAFFLPERLDVDGTVDADTRQRGIFSVPVYALALTLSGEFEAPRLAELGIDPATVDWSRAHVAVGISDARAIQRSTSLTWNGARADFLPGTGGFTDVPGVARPAPMDVDESTDAARATTAPGTGIHAPVSMTAASGRVTFSFPLALNGSLRADIAPFGRTTTVALKGDHPHPSFQGNWLPARRTVGDDGFDARWSISFLGRGYPQAWSSETTQRSGIDQSRFGVALMDPVDHYRMAARSVKYAGLFIVLTFATVWLIEILSGVRVHSIQYLMLGGALCLFYLLLLALAEHIGFPFAYVAASIAVVGMIGAFGVVALRDRRRAMVVAAGVTLLYGYLYFLLMNEDYALLIGSIGLFAALAGIMYVTRRVDWYAVGDGAGAVGGVPLESAGAP